MLQKYEHFPPNSPADKVYCSCEDVFNFIARVDSGIMPTNSTLRNTEENSRIAKRAKSNNYIDYNLKEYYFLILETFFQNKF